MTPEEELAKLRLENAQLKKAIHEANKNKQFPLSLEEYKRYGRQMIVPEFDGVDAQLKLKKSRVLVVGAGGLGCSALPYLCGAGVGHIGIVDNDIVETSNLHRQILHNTAKVGMFKCDSAKEYLLDLNPHVSITTYPVRLDNQNAFEIFAGYDVVLDCTDTPITRYLVSDVAVALGITIVSASGLKTEGQLSILNFKNVGPCYRCFYPKPPPANSVTSCQDGGVIGPVIGLVGVMMATETIKVLTDSYTVENFTPFLAQYAAWPQQSLRTFKMRGRQSKCQSCGKDATITREAIESGTINYAAFCGSMNYSVCAKEERLTVDEFSKLREPFVLLDVRPTEQFRVVSYPNSINMSLNALSRVNQVEDLPQGLGKDENIIVVCRHGNDSQLATKILKDKFGFTKVRDVIGGLFKYAEVVDPSFPTY